MVPESPTPGGPTGPTTPGRRSRDRDDRQDSRAKSCEPRLAEIGLGVAIVFPNVNA